MNHRDGIPGGSGHKMLVLSIAASAHLFFHPLQIRLAFFAHQEPIKIGPSCGAIVMSIDLEKLIIVSKIVI
jgi:hypothetical protein